MKYAIWNKQDPVITPVGEVFTAEQWKAKFPVAALPNITVVCGAGEINGSFFGTLGQMVDMYEDQGCDFTECTTPEQKLAAIEAFEVASTVQAPATEDLTAASLASIAASLEYQNMMTLEDAT